jgi:hypothetical protein
MTILQNMNSPKEDRVTFFSKEDMSIGINLSLAEPILRNFDVNNNFDLNDIIELYHIKQYIDNDLFLSKWSEDEINQFKEKNKNIWKIVSSFLIDIKNDNFLALFDTIYTGYQPAFWSLTEKLEIFKKISKDTFKVVLKRPHLWIREILHQKNLVNFYGSEIRDFLLATNDSAELMLSQYEEHHNRDCPELFFPRCLKSNDIELIISKYIDSQDPNINYLRLITRSRDNTLKLSPHTRLKAKRVTKKKNDEILEKGTSWIVGNEVSLSDVQDEPIKVTWENNIQKISYSKKWIDNQNDDVSLIHNFSLLFDYTDIFGCITLISKKIELDVLEGLMMRSKNDYLAGMAFTLKSNLSHLQLFLYTQYLLRINRNIEGVLSAFVTNYLMERFSLKDFVINFPSKNTSYLEKNRLMVPEIESILKQYKIFVEEGLIEHELLRLNSKSIVFREIPSLNNKKYAYGVGDEFLKLEFIFFSDQSMLSYVGTNKGQYNNFYELLNKEDVCLTDFKIYQISTVEYLIQKGYLMIDSEGFIRIKEKIILFIIGNLSKNEVVSYWHFSKSIRSVIEKMEVEGLLEFRNSLFSELESKYFNYYLNKFDFTNGLDLRNKYAHGTNANSEDEQKNDYFILLKLLILIVLKIEDDLLIYEGCKQLEN